MSKQLEKIKSITNFKPEIAIVLGSGLNKITQEIEIDSRISYKDIPDLPVSTAPNHKGEFIFATISGKKVVLMNGRLHLYEGYSAKEVAMPIRLISQLGVKTIILTNASGGINKNFNVGDFMVIKDHISSFVPSPLVGTNDETIGLRFPSMTNAYDKDLQRLIKKVAFKNKIKIQQGTYVQTYGPQFETPAEIKMFASFGCDAVGMSTVVENIAAVHCGMKVCGISVISNFASGMLDQPITSEEVTETANKVSKDFIKLIKEVVREL